MSGYLTIKATINGDVNRIICIKYDYVTDFRIKYNNDEDVVITISWKEGEYFFQSLKEDENEVSLIADRIQKESCVPVLWKADYHDKNVTKPFGRKEPPPFDINKLAEELGIKDELDALTEK